MRLFIVGCGYVGRALVDSLPSNWQVSALTRSEASAGELLELGVRPVVGHWLRAETLRSLPEVDAILVAVPHRPAEEAGSEPELTHRIGLQNLLEHLPLGWDRLVYLSTTGVYGDCEGQRVNECTPVAPARIGPQMAVEAEEWLRSQPLAERCTTLRLAGIYGPGRIPLARQLLAGEPLKVPQHGCLNLVHVLDIAHVLRRVLTRTMDQATYVLSDGQPVERLEFYRYLAELCGVSEPKFEEPSPENSRARRATSKRIDPARLIDALDYHYAFPSYREGLPPAVAALRDEADES